MDNMYILVENGVLNTRTDEIIYYNDIDNIFWKEYEDHLKGYTQKYKDKLQEYDNYINIMNYEKLLEQYDSGIIDTLPIKPDGYYSKEDIKEAIQSNTLTNEMVRPGNLPIVDKPNIDEFQYENNSELLINLSNKIIKRRDELLKLLDNEINKLIDNGLPTYKHTITRQLLRDINLQPNFPIYVEWPNLVDINED